MPEGQRSSAPEESELEEDCTFPPIVYMCNCLQNSLMAHAVCSCQQLQDIGILAVWRIWRGQVDWYVAMDMTSTAVPYRASKHGIAVTNDRKFTVLVAYSASRSTACARTLALDSHQISVLSPAKLTF